MDQPVISGAQHAGRADAARNRLHLLATARQTLSEQRTDQLTMDGLAERAELGEGAVFRRFGIRAGIFQALPVPAGPWAPTPPVHIRVQLGQLSLDGPT